MFYGEEGVDAGGVRKVTCPVFTLEIRFRGYIKDWAPGKLNGFKEDFARLV